MLALASCPPACGRTLQPGLRGHRPWSIPMLIPGRAPADLEPTPLPCAHGHRCERRGWRCWPVGHQPEGPCLSGLGSPRPALGSASSSVPGGLGKELQLSPNPPATAPVPCQDSHSQSRWEGH